MFWVQLPLEPIRQSDAEWEAAARAAIAPSGRVLVVEDNLVNRQLLVRLLEKLGCVVDVAEVGSKAVHLFEHNQYRMVLMDCQMPEMDGYEAATRIRAYEREHGAQRTPIVAISANSAPGEVERCRLAGMDHQITKPIQAAQLHRSIATYCSARPEIVRRAATT